MRVGGSPVPNAEQQLTKANAAEVEAAVLNDETEDAGEITLQQKPLSTKAGQVLNKANIDEIIKAFKLPDTPAMRGLIAEMARGGIELSSENIEILQKVSEAFPELKPEQTVFMAREGIALNAPNIERFQQFLEHKNLIGEQLNNILEQLPAELAELPAESMDEAQETQRAESNSVIMPEQRSETPEKIIVNYENTPQMAALSEEANEEIGAKPAVQTSEQQEMPEKQAAKIAEKSAPDVYEKNNAQTPEKAETATAETPEKTAANVQEKLVAETPEEAAAPKAEGAAPEVEAAGKQLAQISEKPETAKTETPEKAAVQNTEKLDAEAPEKTTAPVKNEHAVKTADEEGKPLAAANNATQLTQSMDDEPATIEQKLMSLFKKVDAKNPHKLPKELNARELVRELAEVVETVKEKLPELEPARREALGKAVAELEQSVKFLDNLNKFTPIVNLPLQWGDERTTAELYVFNDSQRGKKIDPQNATVFVSLMTANAGRVETMIKVLGKNVECDFSVEIPEVVDDVRGEMHNLYKLLDAQGFRLARSTAQTADKSANIFDVSKVREQNKNRYFFDRKV